MSTVVLYLVCTLLLLAGAYVVFRLLVRRDYQREGKLKPLTSFLELVVWMAFVFFPCIYNPPEWLLPWTAETWVGPALRWFGLILTTGGILLAAVAMASLGIVKSFGRKVDALYLGSLYRFSRNPQLVGGALMVVGIGVLWPSWYALGWLAMYAIIGHMMVITEEEHLHNVYGKAYALYCRRVSRYLGFPRKAV